MTSTGWYIVFSWRGTEILCEQYRSIRRRNDIQQMVAAVLDPGTYYVHAATLGEARELMDSTITQPKQGGTEDVSAYSAKERVH